ncbi:unnamed protein product, partial [Polarella glacialis]
GCLSGLRALLPASLSRRLELPSCAEGEPQAEVCDEHGSASSSDVGLAASREAELEARVAAALAPHLQSLEDTIASELQSAMKRLMKVQVVRQATKRSSWGGWNGAKSEAHFARARASSTDESALPVSRQQESSSEGVLGESREGEE